MTSVRRLFVKAAVGACALAGLASSGAYAASPEGMKLYQFTSQYLDIAKSALSSATSGDEKILVPVGTHSQKNAGRPRKLDVTRRVGLYS